MRNNAFKGEITLLKSEITRKSNALKRQTQMRYNAFESFVSQFRVISLCLYVKACPAILFTIDKDHVFYLMPRSFHLLLVFDYNSLDGQKTIHIHNNKFISWIPMIFTLTVCYSVLDNLVLSVEAYICIQN